MYLQHLKFLVLSKINAHESLQLPALCGLVLHLFTESLPLLLGILKPTGGLRGIRGSRSASVGDWNNALRLFVSMSVPCLGQLLH